MVSQHKQNIDPPEGLVNATRPLGALRQIVAPAGSVVLFSENLLHGALPWHGADERRNLIYKYSPAAISFTKEYVPEGVTDEVLAEMTPEQRGLILPPFVGWPGRPSHLALTGLPAVAGTTRGHMAAAPKL
jgi:hypothetical protein